MISVDRLTKPAPSRVTLDQPVEHLVACHERIEERLRILERAAEALADRPDEARAAIAQVFRHFDSAGVLHTRDEEESVFPRLLPLLTAAEREYLGHLEEQHREAEEIYTRLREVPPAGANPKAWRETVVRFCGLYRAHIASENVELVGAARRLFTAVDLAAIAAEMKERRG